MINFNKSLVLETHRMALAYDDAGTGGCPILLLHGWACDRTFLQPQFEHLSRFHRVFAVELSGHGQSDAPLRNYTLAEFAADVHYFHQALDLPPALIVGHGMGGQVGLELAATHPQGVAAACLIDSVMFTSLALTAMFRRLLPDLAGSGYLDALAAAAGPLFIDTDDHSLEADLMDRMRRTPQHVAVAAFRHICSTTTSRLPRQRVRFRQPTWEPHGD